LTYHALHADLPKDPEPIVGDPETTFIALHQRARPRHSVPYGQPRTEWNRVVPCIERYDGPGNQFAPESHAVKDFVT
jgi:hypothetical protein